MSTTDLQKYKESGVFDLEEVKHQKKLINEVFKEIMKKDIHFGVIPGTQKPTLYKPGAEVVNFMFRLSASYECEYRDLDNGHREVIATCTLTHIPTGQIWGQAEASCTTMEGKYRFRTGDKILTDRPVPQAYWTDRDQKLIGGKGFGTMKNPDTGKWMIAEAGEKCEHDNPADYHNTVLKMAQKRATTSAVIGATAASDIFTVDIEDMPEVIPGAENLKQNADPEVVDVTPEPTPPDQGVGVGSPPELSADEAEEDWAREEARQAEQAGKGEQASIPTDPPKNEYEDRPPPESLRIDNGKAKILYAKWKNIPGYTVEQKDQVLKDMGLKSVYDALETDFEKHKKHLDMFYPDKK